jgi:hypothetical protein
MKRIKRFIPLLLLPIVVCCDNSDDVLKIFTGKTWKLTKIVDAQKTGAATFDFWSDDEEAYKKSMEILSRSDTFVLTFTGAEADNTVLGNCVGKAASIIINNAQWSANGESREFSLRGVPTSTDSDIFGQKFLEGLSNATRYGGDENNLYLYYKDSSGDKCMFFRVNK